MGSTAGFTPHNAFRKGESNAKVFIYLFDSATGFGLSGRASTLSARIRAETNGGTINFNAEYGGSFTELDPSNPVCNGWYVMSLTAAQTNGDRVIIHINAGSTPWWYAAQIKADVGLPVGSRIAYDSVRRKLWAISGTGGGPLYSVDTLTGDLSASVGNTGQVWSDLSFDPVGDILYGNVAGGSYYTINRDNAALVSQYVGPTQSRAFAHDGDSYLSIFTQDGNPNVLFFMAPGLFSRSMSGYTTTIQLMEWVRSGLFLAGVEDVAGGDAYLRMFSQKGGVAARTITTTGIDEVEGLAYDPFEGVFFLLADLGSTRALYKAYPLFGVATSRPVIVYPSTNYEADVLGAGFTASTDSLSALRGAMEQTLTPIVRTV